MSVEPKNQSDISIRPVVLSDSSLLLRWRNHPEVRKWSRDVNEIEADSHQIWLNTWILNQQTKGYFYVIEYSGTPVGTIRFDLICKDSFEVSILVEPSFQGRGIAMGAIRTALLKIGSKFSYFTILASVHEKNLPSIRLFTNLGFQESGKSGNFLEFSRSVHFENF